MEQYGIPVKYVFADDYGRNTDINILHKTLTPVANHTLPRFEVHSSTSKQTLKNKVITDESNHVVASSLRMPNGNVLTIPDPPKKGEVVLSLVDGKSAWRGSNDDRVNLLISSVDNMMSGITGAMERIEARMDALDKRIDDVCSRVDKRFEEFEEMVDIDTTRANMARLRSEVSVIMDLIDGFASDEVPQGSPMSAKLAKNIVGESNPTFADGRVYVNGRIVDIIGALCRLASNNNIISAKKSE